MTYSDESGADTLEKFLSGGVEHPKIQKSKKKLAGIKSLDLGLISAKKVTISFRQKHSSALSYGTLKRLGRVLMSRILGNDTVAKTDRVLLHE